MDNGQTALVEVRQENIANPAKQIAERIRHKVDTYTAAFPALLEIPSRTTHTTRRRTVSCVVSAGCLENKQEGEKRTRGQEEVVYTTNRRYGVIASS